MRRTIETTLIGFPELNGESSVKLEVLPDLWVASTLVYACLCGSDSGASTSVIGYLRLPKTEAYTD